MSKYDNRFPITGGMNPWFAIPVVILFSIGSMIIFSEIAMVLIKQFFGLSRTEFYLMIQNQQLNETATWALFLLQAFSAFGGFIVGPLFYILVVEKHPLESVFSGKGVYGTAVVTTVMIVLSFMVVNAVVLRWNMGIELPAFMEEFERWAKQKEDEAAQITRNLTFMPTTMHLLVALLVIAVLPAIGEELLFRGLIQNKLYAITGNIHWAIWLAGVFFSIIHIQFYGLFPRMLLGVLFGYLYFWSKNLWLPIIAHFVNNGFTIMILYFSQHGIYEYDLEEPPPVPLTVFFVFLAINIGLIWYFYQYYKGKIATKDYK